MRRHKTQRWQVAPSASKLPLWGDEIHWVIWIEGACLILSHNGNGAIGFITYRSQKWRSQLSQGKVVLHPDHTPAGDRSRLASTYELKVAGVDIPNFSQA